MHPPRLGGQRDPSLLEHLALRRLRRRLARLDAAGRRVQQPVPPPPEAQNLVAAADDVDDDAVADPHGRQVTSRRGGS